MYDFNMIIFKCVIIISCSMCIIHEVNISNNFFKIFILILIHLFTQCTLVNDIFSFKNNKRLNFKYIYVYNSSQKINCEKRTKECVAYSVSTV